MDAYGSKSDLGNFASIANALTYVRNNKWDHKGDGTGYFQMGQYFYHTVEEQHYYAQWGSIWGEFYTHDPDLQQLPWITSAGNGVVTDDDGYTTFKLAADGTDCGWATGDSPRKTLALPPIYFMMYVHVTMIDVDVERYKFARFGVFNSSDLSKINHAMFYRQDATNWVAKSFTGGDSGWTSMGAAVEQWLAAHYIPTPAVPHRTSRSYTGTDPSPTTGYNVAAVLGNASVITAGTGKWEADTIVCTGLNEAGANNKSFEFRFDNFYLFQAGGF